ncbi:MAG: SIMPL domain-containing protein [Candidatus Gracilibacteria bacterium]
MEKQQSFPKSFLQVMVGIFLVTLTVALFLNLISGRWYQSIKAEVTSQPYARTITVDGEGKITATPDTAIIDLSVVSQGKTVKAVTEDGNKKMTAVIAAVKNLKVDAKDITTTQFSLYPQYDYQDYSSPRITGYELNQSITVKLKGVDQLDKVDDVIDAGLTAGANRVGQLTFDVDDMAAVKKQSRQKAFDAAKLKAKEMADAAGVNLGRVVTFSEGYTYQPQMYANYKMDYAAEEAMPITAATPIQPGSKDFSMNVSVTYEIE